MGLNRILTRDRRYHLTIQNTVKEFVTTVEYDLRMFRNVPNWTRTPIQVRQDTILKETQKLHGPEVTQKVKSILEKRSLKLEKLWRRSDLEKAELLSTPYEPDPEIEKLLENC